MTKCWKYATQITFYFFFFLHLQTKMTPDICIAQSLPKLWVQKLSLWRFRGHGHVESPIQPPPPPAPADPVALWGHTFSSQVLLFNFFIFSSPLIGWLISLGGWDGRIRSGMAAREPICWQPLAVSCWKRYSGSHSAGTDHRTLHFVF